MSTKLLSPLLSILLGLILRYHTKYLSGLNPAFGNAVLLFFGVLVVINLVLIFRQPNKKSKLLHVIILVVALGFGLAWSMYEVNSMKGQPLRFYQGQ